jgi:hypothetical protein
MNYEGDTFEDAVEAIVDGVLRGVSTFFPGIIREAKPSPINPNVYIANVFSSFLQVDLETKIPSPRQIFDVPIMLPGRTNTFMIRPPMDPLSLSGASCGLIVANNYLDNWQKTGGTVLPQDGGKFHYSDAVCMLGLYPDLVGWPTQPKANTAQIKVLDGTFLEIGNSTSDLFRMMQDLLTILSTNAALIDGAAGSTLATLAGSNGDTLATILSKLATLANPDPTP